MTEVSLNLPFKDNYCKDSLNLITYLFNKYNKKKYINLASNFFLDSIDTDPTFNESLVEWNNLISKINHSTLIINSHDYFYMFLNKNGRPLFKIYPPFERFKVSQSFLYFDPGEESVIRYSSIDYNTWLSNSIYQCLSRKGIFLVKDSSNYLDIKSRNAIINEISKDFHYSLNTMHINDFLNITL